MKRKMPAYRGSLGPVQWAAFRLTPDLERNLSRQALRSCPVCRGKGYRKSPRVSSGTATPCRCVIGQIEPRP